MERIPALLFLFRPVLSPFILLLYGVSFSLLPFPFSFLVCCNRLDISTCIKNFIKILKKVVDMFCRYVESLYFCTRFRR